ncbi:MAG: KTSC domain-containing protein [Ferruginibacter sp.]
MPSSVVARIHYDTTSQVLQIVFVSGMVYAYKNVPEEEYLKMKNSRSKGTYLNQHIKGNYQFEKISD